MRTREIVGVAALSTVVAATATAVGLQGAQAAQSGCGVRYVVSSDWGSGATVNVDITNYGPSISRWTLSWTFSSDQQRVTNGWSGTYSQIGRTVTVTNADYNGTIPTGGSASTGFNLTYNPTNPAPPAFTLNGQICSGPSTSPSPSPSTSGSGSPSSSPSTSPSTSTSTPPGTGLTGNATHFDSLGSPYGGCGLPQSELDSQHFVALNVYNTPGDYTTYYPRPMPSSLGSKIGAWDNGRNCGRWVQVKIGDFCTGINDGAPGQPFCRNGSWVSDQYNGATLTMLVADSCGDGNAWCRDDPNHLDLATASLNQFVKNGAAVGDMYPNHWGNRHIEWSYVPPPNYSGDLRIGFMQNADRYWPAIAVNHLPNGVHGVEYFADGSWHGATMNSDMGQSYIIGATVAQGTDFRIRVKDAADQLVNGGRTYSFALPSSCSPKCGGAFNQVPYTTG